MAQPLLDDALWAHVEPLLPKPRRPARRRGGWPRVSERAAFTGIQSVLRDGLPWQMLQREMGCGSGSTCWRRLHDTLLAELRRWGRLDQRWTVVDQRVGPRDALGEQLDRAQPIAQGRVQTPHRDRLVARGIVVIFRPSWHVPRQRPWSVPLGRRAYACLAPPVSSPRRSL